MRNLLAAIFLSIACLSCRAYVMLDPIIRLPKTVRYRCDPALKASFLAQFSQWNNACSGYFTPVEATDTADLDIRFSDSISPRLGWTDNGKILITSTMPAWENPDSVMLHELGHALGLGHPDGTLAIMYAVMMPGRSPSLTQDDVNGARRIYGLAFVDLASLDVNASGFGKSRIFSSSGYSMRWDFGDGTNMEGQKVKHFFAVPGTYTVTATYLGYEQTISVTIGHPKRHKK